MVYVMGCEGSRLVKIGWALDAENRCKERSAGCLRTQ